MPTTYYRIESPGINILDTVSHQIVFGLLSEFDLTQTFKDSVYIMSSFRASSNYSDPDGTPNLIKRRCDVDIEFVLDKAQVPWPVETPFTTAAYGVRNNAAGQHFPILADPGAEILIEHHTEACSMDMTFTLTLPTFDEATRAFYTIKSRHQGTLVQTPFDLSFSYPVSMSLLGFLVSVYKCREGYADKSFMDYITDKRLTEISLDVRTSELDQPDADKELMVRCIAKQCLGILTMDQREPEPEMENRLPDGYTIKFTYQIQFGIPSRVSVHTPVSVDNTLLPPELFSSLDINHHEFLHKQGLHDNLMFSEWLAQTDSSRGKMSTLIRMPGYDDWNSFDTLYAYHQYRPFLIAHFTLDDGETIIDLNDLGAVTLHPVIKDIIRQTGNKIFDYGGMLTLGVYAGDLRLGVPLVEITDDLKLVVRSARKDQVYHLMLSETTDLTKTDGQWDDLLIKYRYFFPLTIEKNIESLVQKKIISVTGSNTFVNLVNQLWSRGRIKSVLTDMVTLGEDTSQLFQYTQSPAQLVDYLSNVKSVRNYTQDDLEDAPEDVIQYYTDHASIYDRSLYVAFVEACLRKGYVTSDTIPLQYLRENTGTYPYLSTNGGFYAFNAPFRILTTTIRG